MGSEVHASTLDLAVQEVGVGGEEDRCEGKDTGECLGGLALGGSSADRSAGGFQAWQDVVDVVAAGGILVADFQLFFAFGGQFVALFAEFGDFEFLLVVVSVSVSVVVVIVVVVLVLVDGLAVHALAGDNSFAGEGESLSVVVRGPDLEAFLAGLGGTGLVVKDTKVDALSVRGAVGSNVVHHVVVVLVFHFCVYER